ncbi:hypothetical protein QYE76_055228 [Lolium multiflorum]|uniref:GDSL esterase/lipase n=1 Tax=Lolium multiflorum TaxID=4521 RepID=A0AAD8SZW5_LOLMU|nr:hypothetical protein QYE76_055228 [Lolium multiflorum]
MASGVLRASLWCVLATLVWAGNVNPVLSSAPAVGSNVACKDIEGKRPSCTGNCPASCPQQCLIFCPGCQTFCRPDQVRPAVRPAAIFIFGDGNLDVGNSNILASGDYDIPHDEQQTLYPQWVGTDGDNIAQFIAKFMGFQGSPPAYLTLPRSIHVGKGFTGVNYACAGAGLRDLDPNMDGWLTITMSKQLQQFAATRAQMEAKLGGAQAVKVFLAKSFFLIEVGGVDLTHYLPYPYGPTEVRDLLALYEGKIKSLHSMGARRFGLINVGLIGNLRSLGGGYDVADMNKHAAEFNRGLKTLLAGLAKTLPGLHYSIADLYTFTQTVFANPSDYGFEDIQTPCSEYYGDSSQPHCDNPAKHWFWDEYGYITEHAANLVATTFFYGPPQFTAPVIFRSLLDVK